jgi:beta-phosphoglucomutase
LPELDCRSRITYDILMAVEPLGVIFDVDGVLVDSYRPHLESWQRAVKKRGLSMSEADFARTFGKRSREIIAQLWPGKFEDAAIQRLDEEKEAEYREILRANFPEMEGASDLIAALHAARFKLAIGSSGPPENVELVRRTIRHGELLSAAVSGKDVTRGKPDPEVFLTAARKLEIEPTRCAVVEDAPVGLEAARRAGMAAIGLTGTAPREALAKYAHVVVDSLRQLSPAMIASLIEKKMNNVSDVV